jgi:hypothetical protein
VLNIIQLKSFSLTENHLEYHIISTLCIEEVDTSFHLCLKTIHPTHGIPHTRGTQHSISVSERNHTPSSWDSLHKGTQHSISISERNHTPRSWDSPPHTGAQCSISVSERNHTPISWVHPTHGPPHPTQGYTQRSFSISERNNTPISWAHPTYGISLRLTHSVYVLEDVSHIFNHQQVDKCTDDYFLINHDFKHSPK